MAIATLAAKEPVRPNVILELTSKEAEALALILSAVGGSPTGSKRRYSESIMHALSEIGYRYSAQAYSEEVQTSMFLNNEKVKS